MMAVTALDGQFSPNLPGLNAARLEAGLYYLANASLAKSSVGTFAPAAAG